jgi:2-C-methyl-D-erythritol 4-phosphate cytidylyltransferase
VTGAGASAAAPGGSVGGRTVAVVLAAGAADLPGTAVPAVLAPLAGKPVIEHSVAAFETAPRVGEILVVAPPSLAAQVRWLLAAGGYRKVSRVIEGGATRTESARRAIAALGDADRLLLIHDAARPLVSQRVIEDCITALGSHGAVCAAVAAADTMVAVEKDLITERPPRDRLRCRQTPQGFRLPVIRRGYELALADPASEPADDCGIVLRYLPGVAVRLVQGSEQSFPVTRAADIDIAETLLAAGSRHSNDLSD